MTKPKPKRVAVNTDLRRWCIEMAAHWPVIHVPASYGQAQAGLNQMYQQAMPARDMDADLIGRASKIEAWVKGVSPCASS